MKCDANIKQINYESYRSYSDIVKYLLYNTNINTTIINKYGCAADHEAKQIFGRWSIYSMKIDYNYFAK